MSGILNRLGITLLPILFLSCTARQGFVTYNIEKVEGLVPDYQQAEKFVWDSISKKVYSLNVYPQWFDDNSGFAYQTQTVEGTAFFKVNSKTLNKESAFDSNKLLNQIKTNTGKDYTLDDLKNLNWKNSNTFTFSVGEYRFETDLSDYSLKAIDEPKKDKNISFSPDKKHSVSIKDYNLVLKNEQTQKTVQLSNDGKPNYVYGSTYGWGQVTKGESSIPETELTVSWSPDGKKLLTQILDTSQAKKMYMLDSSIDSLYRPELLWYYRGSPGDMDIVYFIPVIYDIETQRMTKIDISPLPHFMDDLGGWKWSNDSQFLYGTYDHRGYKQKDFIKINSNDGKIEVLFEDKSPTNIDYLTRFVYKDEIKTAFLTSEKTGWKQLYSLDYSTGKLNQITKGKYVIKNIEAIDIQNQTIYFSASGKEKDVNPYYNLLYSIRFDGSNQKLLTPEPLNHEVYFSSDFKYFVDNISGPDTPTLSVLRDSKTGGNVLEVDKADVSELTKTGWNPPQIFTVIAQDGKTVLYGALWKPTHFDPNKKYPIIDYTYTGPHMNVFPNTFRKGVYGLYNSAQSLAELGFIVMQVDGMGTAGRSKSFHDVSYKNMGNNLLDHTLAIKQLGEKYSWIDTNRVGIFGHSAGGYDAAHALLAFNDIYKVAISEAADHDWRMEKAWWPEMYAGWPVDEVYHEQSNITMAPKMKGKLFLIHGAIDENVNPSATFKLSEALIKADKDFDLLILPSARHSFSKEILPYVMKRRWKFFVENLILNFEE